MINEPLKNISELFLNQASEDLERKLFDKAANMILLVVTDFDDNVGVISFLSRNLEGLSPQKGAEFVQELKKEIFWLNSDVLETSTQHDKMHHFTAELIELLLRYGSKLLKSNYYVEAVKCLQEAKELRPTDEEIDEILEKSIEESWECSIEGDNLKLKRIKDRLESYIHLAGPLIVSFRGNIIRRLNLEAQHLQYTKDDMMFGFQDKGPEPSLVYDDEKVTIKVFKGINKGKLILIPK